MPASPGQEEQKKKEESKKAKRRKQKSKKKKPRSRNRVSAIFHFSLFTFHFSLNNPSHRVARITGQYKKPA
ncbi:MAG: hypothetical protein PUH91_02090 [Prevotella sp.]|nr:hypothetical protein [Prevotella sp.]